ncbi:MAG: M14 family metallopeptidase [Anaerolineae bacterium]
MKRLTPLLVLIFAACTPAESVSLISYPTGTPPQLPTSTATPTLPAVTPPTPTQTPFPTIAIPTLTPYPDDDVFAIGESVEGRSIAVWQFGSGSRPIVLVGGIHGGYEANTIVLADQFIEYFRANPDDILPGLRIDIVPSANPDGIERGSGLQGRFNANGVDLNRNWGCEWSDTAFLRDIEVDPGPRPFSEPESFALREYFMTADPLAVIFYHSALGAIFMGECNDAGLADWMGTLLAESTGYPYQDEFTYYEVTGDATNWLAERGIPAAVIELTTRTDSEFEQNLAGVLALQCYWVQRTPGVNLTDPHIIRLCA